MNCDAALQSPVSFDADRRVLPCSSRHSRTDYKIRLRSFSRCPREPGLGLRPHNSDRCWHPTAPTGTLCRILPLVRVIHNSIMESLENWLPLRISAKYPADSIC